MKKLINTILLTCIFYCPFYGSAQFISEDIIKKYPSSVVSRVYEVTLSTFIPFEKQIILADFFVKKDSLISAAVKQQKFPKVVKSMLDSFELVFQSIFNSGEKLQYNILKYQSYMEADAKMSATFIRETYTTKTDIENSIYKLYLSKNQRVLKSLISNGNASNLADSNTRYYHQHDSILNRYLIAAQGELFFIDKIKELSKIKPLALIEQEELRKNYVKQCLNVGDNYHKNFNAAMQLSIRDSIYYVAIYQDSLKELAKNLSKAELENYTYKYSLPKSVQAKIMPILLNKATKGVWLDTRYPFNRKRDSLQNELAETSWLKIKCELIRSGYTALDRSRFVNAMRFQKLLKLTEGQLDTLSQNNLHIDLLTYFYKANNQGATPDYSNYVSGLMKIILSSDQYDTVLLIEAQPQAIADAKQNWEELKKNNLVNGLDSSSSIRPIISYHIARLVLSERYYDDRPTYNKLFKEARQSKPDLLKKLDAIRNGEAENTADKLKLKW